MSADPDHDYEVVWREAGPTLWRAVRAYAAGRQDVADEAVGEAFARVIARGEEVRDPVPYLYRVAFRVAAAELKRIAMTTDLASQPEPVSARGDEHEVWLMLNVLSPEQRAVLYLYYRVDLPVREVASRLGLSGAAVRMHLVRARRRLAASLREAAVE